MELLKRLNKFAATARNGLASHEAPGARLLLEALGKRRPPIPFNPTPASVKVYRAVIASKVALIDRLPSKYRPEASDVVWKAVMKGYDDPALARELHERFGISVERAARLARFQCNMARSVIDHASLVETGVKEAVWRYEDKQCELKSHAAFGGRRYSITGGVLLDGKRVWPGSEPTCFCTIGRVDAATVSEHDCG